MRLVKNASEDGVKLLKLAEIDVLDQKVHKTTEVFKAKRTCMDEVVWSNAVKIAYIRSHSMQNFFCFRKRHFRNLKPLACYFQNIGIVGECAVIGWRGMNI